MKRKTTPTSLDVFCRQFDIDTMRFLKEACENCEHGVYSVCWNIFKTYIGMIAVRATELNDPILNVIMLRMNLYDVPLWDRRRIIEEIKNEVEGNV